MMIFSIMKIIMIQSSLYNIVSIQRQSPNNFTQKHLQIHMYVARQQNNTFEFDN